MLRQASRRIRETDGSSVFLPRMVMMDCFGGGCRPRCSAREYVAGKVVSSKLWVGKPKSPNLFIFPPSPRLKQVDCAYKFFLVHQKVAVSQGNFINKRYPKTRSPKRDFLSGGVVGLCWGKKVEPSLCRVWEGGMTLCYFWGIEIQVSNALFSVLKYERSSRRSG